VRDMYTRTCSTDRPCPSVATVDSHGTLELFELDVFVKEICPQRTQPQIKKSLTNFYGRYLRRPTLLQVKYLLTNGMQRRHRCNALVHRDNKL
jgi:hypothetical protein